jgi:hypothetical protein
MRDLRISAELVLQMVMILREQINRIISDQLPNVPRRKLSHSLQIESPLPSLL